MRTSILGFVSFLLLSFSLAPHAKTLKKKLITREEAVFKVEKDIFFLSDLVPIIKGINFLRCVSPGSFFLNGVGLDKRVLLTIPTIKSVQKLNKLEEDFLGKIIRVIKTTIYIKRRQKEINKGVFSENSYRLCYNCLLYTSPSPRDRQKSRMPSSA